MVKSAKLIKDNNCDYITLILNDETEINFTHIPLNEKLTQHYNGHCHQVTSAFIKDKPSTRRGVMCF